MMTRSWKGESSMFETDSNVWNYVIGAYGVSWFVLIGYSLRLYLLNRRADRAALELEGGA
jgi:hypothetical protein